MRVLFISHLNPFANSFGAEQRTNIIFEALQHLKCNIDIAYIGNERWHKMSGCEEFRIYDFSGRKKSISIISKIKRSCLINMFPASDSLAREMELLIESNHYDYIFCRYLNFAALSGLKSYRNKLFLDIDDMPEQALQIDFTQKKGLKKVYFNLLRKAYRRDTNHWIRRCKQCYVPNKCQAEEYGIGYLPNISSIWAEDIEKFNPNILFIGKLDWKPNNDGIMHFLENCWAEIHAKHPSTKLYIGGKGLNQDQRNRLEYKFEGIKFLGFVEDIKDFYKLGSIVICPIYSGAGTNIKIVEALSMAKILVSSRESIKGYEHFLKDEENCLIAENDQNFIENIITALENPGKAKAIASKGFDDVKGIYSMEYVQSIISKNLGL